MANVRKQGSEREIKPMALSHTDDVEDPANIVGWALEDIRSNNPCISLSRREGVMTPAGAAYREKGSLLELASADTQSPFEAARQDALLQNIAGQSIKRVEEEKDLHQCIATQHTTNYNTRDLQQSTAGHRNFTRYQRISFYGPDLVTVRSVMPLISGAGGFDLHTLQYVTSNRGLRCVRPLSGSTESNRGLIDTKPMPAAHGVRQQFLGDDNPQSQVQNVMVYAMQNMFFECAENSRIPRPNIELERPIEDMHQMILGPQLDHPYLTTDGEEVKASAIARRYLEWYAANEKEPWAQAWMGSEIYRIRSYLDRLDSGGLEAAVGMADHATLHHFWQATLAEHGLDAETAEKARMRLVQMQGVHPNRSILQDSAQQLVKCADALEGEVGSPSNICANYVAAARTFIRIASEYGDIRPNGLYAQLVESGLTAEGVLFDTEHLERYANSPVPDSEGRAAARGKVIIQMHADGTAKNSSATWDYIRNPKLGELDFRNYRETRTDHWVKPCPAPDNRSSLSSAGFRALDEFLYGRESARPLITIDEEGVIPDHVNFDDDPF